MRPGPRVELGRPDGRGLGPDVLAAVSFGRVEAAAKDARYLETGLEPRNGGPVLEVWRCSGAVKPGVAGPIRFAADADHLFGILELDESTGGSLEATTAEAYSAITAFHEKCEQPHLLRMWNYIDAINDGDGDAERYRRFCVGRARGLGRLALGRYPAGTAVGRRDGRRVVQVCWLAGRQAGQPLENPRQVRAYEYPRQYGPAPPSFSRAVLLANGDLMISGTASIVGHESRHPGDLAAQVSETLENITQLFAVAGKRNGGAAPAGLPAGTVLKAYVRSGECFETASRMIREGVPEGVSMLVLEADICRAELLIEVECVCPYDGPSSVAAVPPAAASRIASS